MENYYTLNCPISGASNISTCIDTHIKVMSGHADKVENKRCALASLCWMCPFRNGVRVGGPWSKPGAIPFWSSPREQPATLPPRLTNYALSHTPPRLEDYRRAGMSEVDRELDNFFRKLCGKKVGQTSQKPKKQSASKASQTAPATFQASSDAKQIKARSTRNSEASSSKPLTLKERAEMMRKQREKTA